MSKPTQEFEEDTGVKTPSNVVQKQMFSFGKKLNISNCIDRLAEASKKKEMDKAVLVNYKSSEAESPTDLRVESKQNFKRLEIQIEEAAGAKSNKSTKLEADPIKKQRSLKRNENVPSHYTGGARSSHKAGKSHVKLYGSTEKMLLNEYHSRSLSHS